jgi:hypothetical protein
MGFLNESLCTSQFAVLFLGGFNIICRPNDGCTDRLGTGVVVYVE